MWSSQCHSKSTALTRGEGKAKEQELFVSDSIAVFNFSNSYSLQDATRKRDLKLLHFKRALHSQWIYHLPSCLGPPTF